MFSAPKSAPLTTTTPLIDTNRVIQQRIDVTQSYITKEGDEKEKPSEEQFSNFRVKLVDLTIVTRSYFENLVRALQSGLSEVGKSGSGSDQGAAGGSKGRTRGNGGADGSKRMKITMRVGESSSGDYDL
ncbi:unnamed protein product [Lactuca virosa]|uniref:Uncharacterized protein n=1 Tax=Lactuca virosa TaxID=75947 RepID=A0AAU9NWK0_9ASTR|nr:unnamed protein product [Lactuca virosa]